MKLEVLIVDDSEVTLTLMEHLVGKIDGLLPRCFRTSQEALSWCMLSAPGVIIVDYMMPAPDGIELTRLLRAIPAMANVPILMVTASGVKQVCYDALAAGVTDFLSKPIDKMEFSGRLRNMAALSRSQRLLADRTALLAEEVAAATATIVEREQETVFCLAKAAEYRDPETGSHILRMAHYSRSISEKLGLPPAEQQLIFDAAPMHDIGKVAIPDRILLKPGRLSAEEFDFMKTHASIGHDILAGSASPILRAGATIALSHHEKFDGSGYPNGRVGEAIPLYGRIVAVADVFDALTSARPYKTAWDIERATDYLREQDGVHFDPACIEAFFGNWDQILAIKERFREDAEMTTPSKPGDADWIPID